MRLTGKRSAKALTWSEAETVVKHLRQSTGDTPAGQATGRFAGKLKALWLDGWQLGIVQNPSDRALIAFVQRQTKVDHTRFLTEPEDARPAIEGLKAWIARAAGIEWPADRGDIAGAKKAVALAQFRKLVAIGAWPPEHGRMPDESDLAYFAYRRRLGPSTLGDFREENWDRLIDRLGRWLRTALKKGAGA
ncbi:hypothetical protein J2X65_002014 [Ancylobacter sp. 3268]|nr:hypothetical protein [Ancylobacter sp. 3268]